MELSTHEEHGSAVVAVTDRIDTVTAARFEAYCIAVLDAGAHRLVLDLSHLAYISSAGLSSVLAVAKHAVHVGDPFSVSGLSGLVKEVFAITGFDSMVAVSADLEGALAGF
jgi:anti-anti-sigma factor